MSFAEISGFIPYVSNNIYSSVICQDKVFTKQLLEYNELPVIKYVWCFDNDENKTQIGRYFLGDFYLTLFNPIIGDSDFTAELERDMSTADSGLVTAILKVGTAKACTISFTAGT